MYYINECSICLEPYGTLDVYKIGHNAYPGGKHLFCADCIRSWLQRSPTCPFCRIPMKETDLIKYRNPDFSWKEKIVCWITTKENGGEYQEGIINSAIYCIRDRLDKGLYVPAVSEALGFCAIGLGSLILTVGVIDKISLWRINRNKKKCTEGLFGPTFTINVGQSFAYEGVKLIFQPPTLPLLALWYAMR